MSENAVTKPTESPESPPLESSAPVSSSQPFYKAPERVLAVLIAAALFAWGKLSEEWLGATLLTALGAPLTQAVIGLVKKVRGK